MIGGQDEGILRTESGLLCEIEEHEIMRIKVHETGCWGGNKNNNKRAVKAMRGEKVAGKRDKLKLRSGGE